MTAFQYIRQLITAQSTVQNYLRVYMPGISTKSMCFLFFFISSMMYFKVSIFFFTDIFITQIRSISNDFCDPVFGIEFSQVV